MKNGQPVTLPEVATQALSYLHHYFSGIQHTDKEIKEAKIAVSVVSAYTRDKQTEGAREALQFMMARSLTSNKDELARYIKVALPSAPIRAALKS